MGQLHAEVAVAQLSKTQEELCGDKVEITRTSNGTIVVLSDGLGSGVKANILATLTTKIASSMLKRGIPLDDVVSTIADTLPVCRQRKIAYSTLQILKITHRGLAKIVEFDCPSSFLLRDGRVHSLPLDERVISGKTIKEGNVSLRENDIIVAVSDGVLHAGIGALLTMGWGWRGVARELEDKCTAMKSAEMICQHLINCCEGYYMGKMGDDSTVAVVKIRQPRHLTLLTGPPADPGNDDRVVRRFLQKQGVKVVAGGTTANIVSKVMEKPLRVDLNYYDPKVPPIGYIEGIDLVTEGVLTLNAALERMNDVKALRSPNRQDGATLLARYLLEADMIDIFAGSAVNPVHQNPNFPLQMNLKAQVLSKLQQALNGKGKQVTLEWF